MSPSPASRRGGSAPVVRGAVVDEQTRCAHYAGPHDVVAIRMHCCDEYYPCLSCHAETAGHPITPVPAALFGEPGVLCGVCKAELTVTDYLGAAACPECGAGFNPGCAAHHRVYFALPDTGTD